MITYTQARDALVAHLNSNWEALHPEVPVFYENTLTVDLDKVGARFIKVQIDFTDALQASIDSGAESQEITGDVLVTLFAKAGEGVRSSLVLLDDLNSILQFKTLSGVVLQSPTPGRKQDKNGWVTQELRAPFTFFSR